MTFDAPRGFPDERYPGNPALEKIWWTKEGAGKFVYIHQVELALAQAQGELGIIPQESADAIQLAVYNIEEIIRRGGHDVNDYIDVVRSTLPKDARPGDFHRGATAFDVQDTGLALMLMETSSLLSQDLSDLREALIKLAREYKNTPMIGRSHGVHGKPITFALKVLNWVEFVDRAIFRLGSARDIIAVGKMSGAMGAYTLPPEVEERVCKILGLRPAKVTTQIIPRDLHADFFHPVTCVVTACESIATTIRTLQRTEIREVLEPFPRGMKGSSAMPHKRNPEVSERICGISRTVRNDMAVIYEDVTTWDERSLEQSSAERLTFPEMIIRTSHCVLAMTKVISGLEVFPDRMLANMEITRGAIYSEAIQLLLRDKGVDPETAYRAVQAAAQDAVDGKGDTKSNILADPRVSEKLTAEELDEVMDPWRELQHVGAIYKRFEI